MKTIGALIYYITLIFSAFCITYFPLEKPTYAVCELAALASCSLRGRGSHSRWCCSPPPVLGWPYCPASRHRPAVPRWPAGDGVPTRNTDGDMVRTDIPTNRTGIHSLKKRRKRRSDLREKIPCISFSRVNLQGHRNVCPNDYSCQ